MKEKQQILHVHGGSPWSTYENYINELKTKEISLSPTLKTERWHYNYPKFIPEDTFEIIRLNMPCKENAHYYEWKIWFERHSDFLRDDIILVGHSLGGNFLAKYLAEESFDTKIKQLHLVAASHSAFEDDFKIQEFPGKLLNKKISKVHIYHSQDDLVVPLSESEKYHAQIPQSHFHVFENRGHFLGETFPELFKNIIN
jgi:predicted alpha/beta hydrolase family esterase